MKSFAHLFVFCLIVINLITGLHAGLFLARNGVIYCKWSNRAFCDKTRPYCVQLTVGTVITCKNYKNECQFLIDKCLSRTNYGVSGMSVPNPPNCAALSVGTTGTC